MNESKIVKKKTIRKNRNLPLYKYLWRVISGSFQKLFKLFNYDTFEESVSNSFFVRLFNIKHKVSDYSFRDLEPNFDSIYIRKEKDFTPPIGVKLRESAYQISLIRKIIKFFSDIRFSPVSSIGILLFSCGIISFITRLVILLVKGFNGNGITMVSVLFVISLFSVPLMMKKDRTVISYFSDGFIGRQLLLSLSYDSESDSDRFAPVSVNLYTVLSLVIGVLLGFLIGFFNSFNIILAAGLISLIILCLVSQESGVVIFAFLCPVLLLSSRSDFIVFSLVSAIVIGFLIKLLFGKKSFYFDSFDIIISVVLLALLISDLFSASSFRLDLSIYRFVFLFVFYLVIKNVMKSRKWYELLINSLILSTSLLSSVIIIVWLLNLFKFEFAHLFDPSIGLPIMVSLFIVLGETIKKKRSKMVLLALIFIHSLALVGLNAFYLVIPIFIGLCSFLLLRSKNIIPFFAILIPLVIFLGLIINLFTGLSFFRDISDYLSRNFDNFRESFEISKNNYFFGIGSSYSLHESINNVPIILSESLFISELGNSASFLLASEGIFGLLLASFTFLMILCFIISFSSKIRLHSLANSDESKTFSALSAGFISLIVSGFFIFTWRNMPSISLLFILLALICVLRNSGNDLLMRDNDLFGNLKYDTDIIS